MASTAARAEAKTSMKPSPWDFTSLPRKRATPGG